MILDLKILKEIAIGVEFIEESDGVYKFSRFTKSELQTFKEGFMQKSGAGIQLLFKTDGTNLNMRLKISEIYPGRKYFAFDVFVNDRFKGAVQNFDDSVSNEKYADRSFELGAYTGDFDLGNGEKTVRIVFPHSAIGYVEKIEIDNASYITPVKRDKLLIAYGNSITQGFDALHPSDTYAVKLADYLGAELINKGIGGAAFCPELAGIKNGKNPDLITVAYGTNDWGVMSEAEFTENVQKFIKALTGNYSSAPIVVITPIWRSDCENTDKAAFEFEKLHTIIARACEQYDSIRVINGLELVPHSIDMFADHGVHPNCEGFKHYFNNLIKKSEQIEKVHSASASKKQF